MGIAVYGPEGRLDKKFLSTTKSALRSIADVADHLNESFSLPSNGAMQGVSRVSASLHIMQHQVWKLLSQKLNSNILDSASSSRQGPCFTASWNRGSAVQIPA